ncbi:MAG: hypothetical protein ACRDKI_03205 [Solirubrobacterales bacterium]
MRRFVLLLAAVAVLACFPAEAAAFHYTHRVTISAELTDNWSTDDPVDCGIYGSGSVTIKLATDGSTRIRPLYSKYGARPKGRKLGILVLGVPAGGGVTHMGARKSSGTMTTVDNTTTHPNSPPEDPCVPIKKDGCGTLNIKRATLRASGYDPKHIYGSAFLNSWASCQTGNLENWTQPRELVPGFDKLGNLLFGPTSARKLARSRKTVLTQSDHKVTTVVRNNGITTTDDVTRKMTITITKL